MSTCSRDPMAIGTPRGSRGDCRKVHGRQMPKEPIVNDPLSNLPDHLPERYTEQGLCAGWDGRVYDGSQTPDIDHNEAQEEKRPTGMERMRLKCPRCGRRVLSSVSVCNDGCCLYHSIPPHKPKEWWKNGQ
jgi:hypothetical protein